jgi:hypothetical protein
MVFGTHSIDEGDRFDIWMTDQCLHPNSTESIYTRKVPHVGAVTAKTA